MTDATNYPYRGYRQESANLAPPISMPLPVHSACGHENVLSILYPRFEYPYCFSCDKAQLQRKIKRDIGRLTEEIKAVDDKSYVLHLEWRILRDEEKNEWGENLKIGLAEAEYENSREKGEVLEKEKRLMEEKFQRLKWDWEERWMRSWNG